MFSHIMLGARDAEAMGRFYDAVLAPFDLTRMTGTGPDTPSGIVWHRPGRRWPQFAIRRPYDGNPASVGNGVQLSFAAETREAVDLAFGLALKHGGTDEGAPGIRSRYNDDFYAAYVRDCEGNKLCFVHAGGLGSRS